MTDHSQSGEQAHILKAFEGHDPGLLYDIGACHPTCFSNSRALIELGWSAIMVEPSPGPMQNLLADYGDNLKIKLIQAAVAIEPGLLSMHISDDMVSTSSDEQHERWKSKAKFLGKMLVPVVTLEDLGDRFGGPDFMSIDAEGQSADLFLHAMQIGWRPRCVIVEHDSRSVELMAKASECAYACVFATAENLVFVR